MGDFDFDVSTRGLNVAAVTPRRQARLSFLNDSREMCTLMLTFIASSQSCGFIGINIILNVMMFSVMDAFEVQFNTYQITES